MNKTEYIINDTGQILRRSIEESVVNVGSSISDYLCEGKYTKAITLFEVKAPTGEALRANACFGTNDAYFTFTLPRLPLRTSFKVVDGVLTPDFQAAQLLPMSWTPPAGMVLALLLQCTARTFKNAWLFALTAESAWRLPASNLYGDCRLCLGEFPRVAMTTAEVVTNAVTQFYNSQWNADLWDSNTNTEKMFRFRPDGAGFSTLPPVADNWTTLCRKVGNAFLERVVLR